MSVQGIINTSMRSLKRIPGPDDRLVYTLESNSDQGKQKILCNHCGARPTCELASQLRAHQEMGVKLLVRTCPTFQPILTFRPPLTGFDWEFNTFRIGTAWYYRIGPGVITALLNSVNNEIFGRAEVVETTVGPLSEMCDQYAYLNHSMLGLEQGEASQRMRKLIQRLYGRIELGDDTEITVISLRNVSAEKDGTQPGKT